MLNYIKTKIIKPIIYYLIFIIILPYCIFYNIPVYSYLLCLLDKIKKIRWYTIDEKKLNDLPYDMQRLIINNLPINDYLIKFAIFNYAKTETKINGIIRYFIFNKYLCYKVNPGYVVKPGIFRIYDFVNNIYDDTNYYKEDDAISDIHNKLNQSIIDDKLYQNDIIIFRPEGKNVICKNISKNKILFTINLDGVKQLILSPLNKYCIVQTYLDTYAIIDINNNSFNIIAYRIEITEDDKYVIYHHNLICTVINIETKEIIFNTRANFYLFYQHYLVCQKYDKIIIYERFNNVYHKQTTILSQLSFGMKIDNGYLYIQPSSGNILSIYSIKSGKLVNNILIDTHIRIPVKFFPKYNFYLIYLEYPTFIIFYLYQLDTHQLLYRYETSLIRTIYNIDDNFIHLRWKDVYANINIEKAYNIIQQISRLTYPEYEIFNAITIAMKNREPNVVLKVELTEDQTRIFNSVKLEYPELANLVKHYVIEKN